MKFKMADLSSAVPRIAILVEFNYENLEVTSFCHTPHHVHITMPMNYMYCRFGIHC